MSHNRELLALLEQIRDAAAAAVKLVSAMPDANDNPLLAYRKANNLTQLELANVLGISRHLVSLIEIGERPITAERAIDFEKRIGISRAVLCPQIFRAA
jgi:antitoxin component HigA of HigAB toxin-antitoxin module